MKKINPFRPGAPIVPGMFVGRINEIERIENSLFQTKADRSSHFMITGERGIGKTSLLMYLNYVASKKINVEGSWLNFLVVNLDISANTTPLVLMERIKLALDKELAKEEKVRASLKAAWQVFKRIEIADSRIRDESSGTDHEVLLDRFAYALADVAKRTCGKHNSNSILDATYDGILILLDEADNSPKELQLGSFLKLLLERIQRQGCNRIMVGLAGLPELRDVLRKSHESSLRLFDDITIGRLNEDEVLQVIQRCLEEAEEVNGYETTMEDEAKNLLFTLSEGYPHFIQQFGYSAFDYDKDRNIDVNDVEKGAFFSGGALEQIGNHYYRSDFYNKIQKDSYRQVLRIMADKLDGWVTLSEIKKRFNGGATTLTNAIRALRERHIIISKEGVRGVYRLQHKGFAVWIKQYTADVDPMSDIPLY